MNIKKYLSCHHVSPQIIHFNRVFQYFHHPFWGCFPLFFGNPHILLLPMGTGIPLFLCCFPSPLGGEPNGFGSSLHPFAGRSERNKDSASDSPSIVLRLFLTQEMNMFRRILGGEVRSICTLNNCFTLLQTSKNYKHIIPLQVVFKSHSPSLIPKTSSASTSMTPKMRPNSPPMINAQAKTI